MPYIAKQRVHNPYGKWGLNYQIDDNNSLGLFYSTYKNTSPYNKILSDYEVKEDGKTMGCVNYDDDESQSVYGPLHEADLYYDGKVGKMNINFNATAFWEKTKTIQDAMEMSDELGSRQVNSLNISLFRMVR